MFANVRMRFKAFQFTAARWFHPNVSGAAGRRVGAAWREILRLKKNRGGRAWGSERPPVCFGQVGRGLASLNESQNAGKVKKADALDPSRFTN